MRLFFLILFIALLGFFTTKEPNLGASAVNSLVSEQTEWIKTHSTYKEVKPFVAADGKTYRVDRITKWNGEGKQPDESYQIVIVPPQAVQTPSSTL